MNDDFWKNKLIAYFHDPPDKAIKIMGHEDRAKKILQIRGDFPPLIREADRMASSAQRFTFKPEGREPVIDFYGRSSGKYYHMGHPVLRHPISANRFEGYYEELQKIAKGGYKNIDALLKTVLEAEKSALQRVMEDAGRRFTKEGKQWSYIWQHYKEYLRGELRRTLRDLGIRDVKLENLINEILNLPADTRFPDHTIWHHLDLVSSLAVKKPVLIRIQIVPVQKFIANSRKESDLWASSHLLSMLTFKAIEPVIEEFGPEAIIYPSMKDQPFFLKFMLEEEVKGEEIANLPNKALAIIPEQEFDKLKEKIVKNVEDFLSGLYDEVIEWARQKFNLSDEDYSGYRDILLNYFTVSIEKLELYGETSFGEIEDLLRNAGLYDEDVKILLDAFEKSKEEYGGRLYLIEFYPFLLKILEALGSSTLADDRYKNKKKQPEGWKCWLCGGNLAILGDKKGYKQLKDLWKGEPLCPVCLVKRYYRKWFRETFGKDVSFDSVTDIAIGYNDWIGKLRKNNKHEEFLNNLKRINPDLVKEERPIDSDLYYPEEITEDTIKKKLEEARKPTNINKKAMEDAKKTLNEIYKKIGKPSKYYTILVMDGDDMGKLIAGEVGEDAFKLVNRIHPSLEADLRNKFGEKAEKLKYYSTPQLHRSISETLANFSIHEVPGIVEKNRGLPIYAGGDDILALLPVDTALKAAKELHEKFASEESSRRLMPAWRISAGLLIVHYKHPLYDALEKARQLLKLAKDSGKNRIAIGLLKRSGDYYTGIYRWEKLEDLEKLGELIKEDKIGRRFIYHLMRILNSVPRDKKDPEGTQELLEMVKALIKYEVRRHVKEEAEKEVLKIFENVAESVEDIVSSAAFLKIFSDKEVFP
ncbi:type III-B CRISPR-associated protein Cas10/Cmr2 [Palaeococcus sp. (in: euryarchaeotes)]